MVEATLILEAHLQKKENDFNCWRALGLIY